MAAEAAVYYLAWLLFVGTWSLPEAVLGGCATALALIAAHLVGAGLHAGFTASARALLQVWRLPGVVLSGTADILAVLARHVSGAKAAESLVRAVPYAHTGATEADATLRALATTTTTISPNFVVVDVDRRARVLLFHQIDPTPVPAMTIALGARP